MRKFLFLSLFLSGIPVFGGLIQNPGPNIAAITVVAGGGGTPTLVQSSCTQSSKVDPISLTFNSAFTIGNTSVFGVVDTGETLDSTGGSDNKSNVYTMYPAATIGDSGARAAFYVSTNTTGGGSGMTVTIDASGTGATMSGCIAEFSGVTAVKTSSKTLATSVNVNTGTATYSGSSALALGLMTFSTGGTITITPINSETQIGEIENNSAYQAFSMVYKLLGSTPESMRWTMGSSVAHKEGMLILQ